jgi:peptidoglycan/xylan/chitin deacetylase (PgdA/CDA1 family)
MGDDRPYLLEVDDGPIVELPVHWSLDDWEQYAYLPSPQIGSVIESPRKVLEMWREELDAMRQYRCLLNLCMHPFLSGRPSRLLALRELIEYAQSCGDVRFALCRDLADAARTDPTLLPRTPPVVEPDPTVYPD